MARGWRPGCIFGTFVALLQAQIRVSGTVKCHAPAVFGTERAACKHRSGAKGREREEVRDNCNGSLDRTGSAVGPGADRRVGRNAVGVFDSSARAGAAATAKSTCA